MPFGISQIVISGRDKHSLQRQKKIAETSNPLHGGIPSVHPVLCSKIDIRQPGALESTLAEFKPDVVVHTAGFVNLSLLTKVSIPAYTCIRQ